MCLLGTATPPYQWKGYDRTVSNSLILSNSKEKVFSNVFQFFRVSVFLSVRLPACLSTSLCVRVLEEMCV